ncbi:MAG: FAD-dependent monooxygenase [Solirubrobacteraceae bacterium]
MSTHNHLRPAPLTDATLLDMPVLIIGGGAAGLASSLLLTRLGIETLQQRTARAHTGWRRRQRARP